MSADFRPSASATADMSWYVDFRFSTTKGRQIPDDSKFIFTFLAIRGPHRIKEVHTFWMWTGIIGICFLSFSKFPVDSLLLWISLVLKILL